MMYAAYGAWVGEVLVRLLAVQGWIRFGARPAGAGIRSYCMLKAYPKDVDYFWYALALAAGIAGAFAFRALAAAAARRIRRPAARWPLPAGAAALAAATLLLASRHAGSPVTAVLVLAGVALPWLDARWGRGTAPASGGPPARGGRHMRWWAAGSLVAAAALAWDPCLSYRSIDGLHEGGHLLYVQSALAGDLPGLDAVVEYGPLYTRSLLWWMRADAMTLAAERRYFSFVQWAGTVLCLVALWWLCRSRVARLAGAVFMLTLTTAPLVEFGWSNTLRPGLALAALALSLSALEAGSRLRAALAGVLLGAGWLYSPEFALAAAVAVVASVAAAARGRGAPRHLAAVAAGGLGAAASLLVVMFGARTGEFLLRAPAGGFIAARFLGYGARPFIPLIHWDDWKVFREYFFNDAMILAVWLPVILVPLAAAWRAGASAGERAGNWPRLLAVSVFAVLAQVPAVIRPMEQIKMCAPGAVALAAVLLDLAEARRGAARRAARAGAALLAAFGGLVFVSIAAAQAGKLQCLRFPFSIREAPPGLDRLGPIAMLPERADELRALVESVSILCPPGKRVYLAAPFHAHACFLADRAALGPYPCPFVATTASRRDAILAALDRDKPPVAVVGGGGVDIPYEDEHAEEWAYVRAHYRLARTIGEVRVYVRK